MDLYFNDKDYVIAQVDITSETGEDLTDKSFRIEITNFVEGSVLSKELEGIKYLVFFKEYMLDNVATCKIIPNYNKENFLIINIKKEGQTEEEKTEEEEKVEDISFFTLCKSEINNGEFTISAITKNRSDQYTNEWLLDWKKQTITDGRLGEGLKEIASDVFVTTEKENGEVLYTYCNVFNLSGDPTDYKLYFNTFSENNTIESISIPFEDIPYPQEAINRFVSVYVTCNIGNITLYFNGDENEKPITINNANEPLYLKTLPYGNYYFSTKKTDGDEKHIALAPSVLQAPCSSSEVILADMKKVSDLKTLEILLKITNSSYQDGIIPFKISNNDTNFYGDGLASTRLIDLNIKRKDEVFSANEAYKRVKDNIEVLDGGEWVNVGDETITLKRNFTLSERSAKVSFTYGDKTQVLTIKQDKGDRTYIKTPFFIYNKILCTDSVKIGEPTLTKATIYFDNIQNTINLVGNYYFNDNIKCFLETAVEKYGSQTRINSISVKVNGVPYDINFPINNNVRYTLNDEDDGKTVNSFFLDSLNTLSLIYVYVVLVNVKVNESRRTTVVNVSFMNNKKQNVTFNMEILLTNGRTIKKTFAMNGVSQTQEIPLTDGTFDKFSSITVTNKYPNDKFIFIEN